MPDSSAPADDLAPSRLDLPLLLPWLPREVSEFLSLPGTHVLFVQGPPGSGKSAFSAELLARLEGNLALVTPAGGSIDPRFTRFLDGASGGRVFHVSMTDDHDGPTSGALPASLFTMGAPHDATADRPRWISEILERFAPAPHSCILVDPWLLAAPEPRRLRNASGGPAPRPLTTLETVRSALQGIPFHLILVAEAGLGENEASNMDGVIETGTVALPFGTVRVMSLRKLRGVSISVSEYPYTLTDGRFHCVPALPPGFRPPVGPPDPSPPSRSGFLWPGSTAFADNFGWLRYGAMTAIELSETTPDSITAALVTPVIAHALRDGGRVVWVPPPTTLPEDCLESLGHWFPASRLAGQLRILSAGGEEADPLIRSVLLSLPLHAGTPPPAPTGTAARVAPAFLEMLKFLQETDAGRPALFVLSFEGLRAVAAITGVHYDPATFPLIVARYVRLPGFHGLGLARPSDVLGSTVLASTDLALRADAKFGRIFLTGTRPETLPYALDWEPGDPRYHLVRMS